MNYNPEQIMSKRPRGGEVWVRKDDSAIWVKVIARWTTSTLFTLGRRDSLEECDDKASIVGYYGKEAGALSETEFVERYVYSGPPESS